MPKVSKFTEEQKVEIALDLLSGKLSHAEVCRKYGISSTYAYKVKDRAIELLRQGIGRPVGRVDAGTEHLQKRITELEQLAGDQALAIRHPLDPVIARTLSGGDQIRILPRHSRIGHVLSVGLPHAVADRHRQDNPKHQQVYPWRPPGRVVLGARTA